MDQLWTVASIAQWRNALARYAEVIARQGVASLPALDEWYRTELPRAIHARQPPHVKHPELVRLTEWKMARGVWRGPNLVRVRGNDHRVVEDVSTSALAQVPHPTAPISVLAKLDGVGPATASAVAAAAAPVVYPFFDELVAGQVPELGKVAWTLAFFARYATALRARAADIGAGWTPVMVERALWAHVGGKAGNAGSQTGTGASG